METIALTFLVEIVGFGGWKEWALGMIKGILLSLKKKVYFILVHYAKKMSYFRTRWAINSLISTVRLLVVGHDS